MKIANTNMKSLPREIYQQSPRGTAVVGDRPQEPNHRKVRGRKDAFAGSEDVVKEGLIASSFTRDLQANLGRRHPGHPHYIIIKRSKGE